MRKILSFFAFVAIVLSFAACGGKDGNVPEVIVQGKFSVGDGKQVYFAKGNLWRSTNLITMEKMWYFSPHQWDMIGDAPSMHTERYSWNELNESWDNWTINTIQNGGGYTWRVLNNKEWNYLFHRRDNADKLFTHANVHGVNGVIILPDDWDIDHETDLTLNTLEWVDALNGQYKGNSTNDCYAINTITDQWDALEKKGAIFLPAAGSNAPNKPVENFGSNGAYLSSTPYVVGDDIYYLLFESYRLHPSWSYIPSILRTVRLVRDVE